MQLKPGTQMRSQVCATAVMVIRPGSGDIDLRCGGAPMSADDAAAPGIPEPGLDGGSQLGKRYVAVDDVSLELLVTKAGAGTLSVGTEPLQLKEAKPLPSSD